MLKDPLLLTLLVTQTSLPPSFTSLLPSVSFLSTASLNSDKSEEILSIKLEIPLIVSSAASSLRLVFSICHKSLAGVLLFLRKIIGLNHLL